MEPKEIFVCTYPCYILWVNMNSGLRNWGPMHVFYLFLIHSEIHDLIISDQKFYTNNRKNTQRLHQQTIAMTKNHLINNESIPKLDKQVKHKFQMCH